MTTAEALAVVREALELGTGPNADSPMGEYHDKAVAALDNLVEQLEALRELEAALRRITAFPYVNDGAALRMSAIARRALGGGEV